MNSRLRPPARRLLGWGLPLATLGCVLGWAEPATVETAAPERVYTVQELDEQPVARFQARPEYPFELRRNHVEGRALVFFVVSEDGIVRDAQFAEATHPEFGDAAVAAVIQWRFRPGRIGGQPVSTVLRVPIVFSITSNEPLEELPPDTPVEGPVVNFRDAEVQPKVLITQKPDYPIELRAKNITGSVVLAFVVDRRGNVRQVRAIQSTDERFTDAAINALRRWRFAPGRVDADPVNVAMQIPMVFNLSD